jgi:uncharacterized protein (DUF58 family)
LTFLVTSIALVGMYHTHRNLSRLQLKGQRAAPVHAGETASFELLISNPTPEARFALNFALLMPTRRKRRHGKVERPMRGVWVDVPAASTAQVGIGMPTRRRGRRPCPRIRIGTRYPFGLWEAWAYLTPSLSAIVYPTPEADPPPLPLGGGGDLSESAALIAGGDDFGGVRPYQPGDPRRAIAWKLAARSDELTVRLFESNAGEEIVLDFDAMPSSLGIEARLSRLTSWVLMAEAANLRYGLMLPGAALLPGSGARHRERCLETLALFRAD